MLLVSTNRSASSRGRWLAFGGALVVSAGMLYAQGTEPHCCVKKVAATAPIAAPAPSPQPAPAAVPVAGPPRIASAAEVQSLAADAPAAAQSFQFALPTGVAPESGLQVKTIWAARAISLLFPRSPRSAGIARTRCGGIPAGWRST